MRIHRNTVRRLSYVVPGYIWRQGHLRYEPPKEVLEIIRRGNGVVFVGSPSLQRREYALAWCLGKVLERDYHSPIDWCSWFYRDPDSFTSAIHVPEYAPTLAISIKEENTNKQLDSVRDLLCSHRLCFVASQWSGLALAKKLHLPAFAVMDIKANDANSTTI